MVFIWASILAIWSEVPAVLAAAAPIGIIGAVLQAIKVLATESARARGMNLNWVMTNTWLGWEALINSFHGLWLFLFLVDDPRHDGANHDNLY